MISLGNRLVSLRIEKNILLGELAEMVGFHNNVLGRYERGNITQSIEHLDHEIRKNVFFLIDNAIQNYKTKKAFAI